MRRVPISPLETLHSQRYALLAHPFQSFNCIKPAASQQILAVLQACGQALVYEPDYPWGSTSCLEVAQTLANFCAGLAILASGLPTARSRSKLTGSWAFQDFQDTNHSCELWLLPHPCDLCMANTQPLVTLVTASHTAGPLGPPMAPWHLCF